MPTQPDYIPTAILGREQNPWTRAGLFLFVWVPAALFVLGLFSCLLGAFAAVLGILMGPAFALFIVFVVRRNFIVQRERRAMIVLGYIENAVRLNLPLDRFLEAAEASERGATRKMLAAIRQLLLRGVPIGAALEAGAPEIPERLIRAAAAGEQVGQLQPTLTRLVRAADRDRPTINEESEPFYRIYLVYVIFGVMFVNMGLMIFVVPKFRDIFKDFHTTLPPLTQFIMDLSDWVANEYGWVFFLPLILLLIFLLARQLQRIFTPASTSIISPNVYQWFAWHLPFLHQLQRDRAFSDVFDFLADALRAGLPLPDALQGALTLDMNYHVRDSLLQWRSAILAGAPTAQAARNARLPDFLVGLLDTGHASRASNTPRSIADMFQFLARYHRERFSRLLVALRAAAEPIAVVTIGSLVGILVYAMFSPLVVLLQSVSGNSVSTNGVL
ncbi:MAG TPA: type II secretion system F family protein [Phycisphaerae bacterium]|nr:type II secretion system F family protein [Phycisphaerae bacterium]